MKSEDYLVGNSLNCSLSTIITFSFIIPFKLTGGIITIFTGRCSVLACNTPLVVPTVRLDRRRAGDSGSVSVLFFVSYIMSQSSGSIINRQENAIARNNLARW